MIKTIRSPHDKFFKAAMSDLRVAKDFFDFHLPPSIKKTIELDTLAISKGSFVDPTLVESATDMLFTVDFAGQSGYLYVLVEHQSTPDKLMPFRIFKYIMNIMDHHLKSKSSEQACLPVVYPLLFYTGASNYNFSTDIFDLFCESKDLAKQVFMQPFQLIQINQIADEVLKQRVWSGIMELSMKHIFQSNILSYLKSVLSLLEKIKMADDHDYAQTVLTYIFNTAEISDKQTFSQMIRENVSPEIEEIVMTPAQYFREEGFEKGIEKGIEKGRVNEKKDLAKKLIQHGLTLSDVSKLTDLSIAELENLDAS